MSPQSQPGQSFRFDQLSTTGCNWIAFSGGADSVCLLDCVREFRTQFEIQVVHIDHGLDAESAARARRAVELAAGLGFDCRVECLCIEPPYPGGLEAAARQARYRRFEALMQAEDRLLTAHHADDQAETVLLRLLRGAGPRGLVGMRPARRLGDGWLIRPLLEWSREDILKRLAQRALNWIEDPTNRNLELDRNFLRLEVIPAIRRRWPSWRSSLLTARDWQALAADALGRETARRLDEVSTTTAGGELVLELGAWTRRDELQACALVRAFCAHRSVPPPPLARLREFVRQSARAGADRQPLLDWRFGQLHAWRARVWLDYKPLPPAPWRVSWQPDRAPRIELPVGGALVWRGPAPPAEFRCLRVQSTPPAAALRSNPNRPAARITELMRQAGIPPWRRPWMPALLADSGQPLALGPDWLDVGFAEALKARGTQLAWHDRPITLLPSYR